jgi:hypothetical protein
MMYKKMQIRAVLSRRATALTVWHWSCETCSCADKKPSTHEKKPIPSAVTRWPQTAHGWFFVDDVEYAARFAKAFRHAVELCGGKPEPFDEH